MMTTLLIEKTKMHCKALMQNSRCKELPFHNWEHTKNVVSNAEFIARHEELSEASIENIIIASYFHDIGNIDGSIGHEAQSCDYAEVFLTAQGVAIERVQKILNIISATEMPQNPTSLEQKVICDADLAHLGKLNFSTHNKNLRREWELYNNLTFTDEQWVEMNICFLESHRYHTSFAKANYTKQKKINIKMF